MSIDEYGNWYQQTLQQLNYMGGKKLKHKSKKHKTNTRKIKNKNL